MNSIVAYYCSWHYPPGEDVRRKDPWFPTARRYAEISIQKTDGTWEVIWRRRIQYEQIDAGGGPCEAKVDYQPEMARKILEHFSGEKASDAMVHKFLHRRGKSMMRNESAELVEFLKQGFLF